MKTHSIKVLAILLGVFWLMAGCQKDDLTLDEPVVGNIAVSSRTSLRILPSGEYPYGQATSINKLGQIVGVTFGEFTFWDGDEMTHLSKGDQIFTWTTWASINNRGQISGSTSEPLGSGYPFYWESRDGDLVQLPGGHGSAAAINNRGQVAGYANGRPIVWENGVPNELPIGEFPGGGAYSINAQGDVVGTVGGQPALWRNGELSFLPSGEFMYCYALSINSRKQIVGVAYSTGWVSKPALWENGQLTILPLGEYLSGIAYSINTRGQIVGYVVTTDWKDKPALWENGQLYILPMDGHDEGVAYCINDRGQIVGHVDNLPVLWE